MRVWPKALLAVVCVAILTPALLVGSRSGWTWSALALVFGPAAVLAFLFWSYERQAQRESGQARPPWWKFAESPRYALTMGTLWLLVAAYDGLSAVFGQQSPLLALFWGALGATSLTAGLKHRHHLRRTRGSRAG